MSGGAQWSCGPSVDSVFDGPVLFQGDTFGWVGGGEHPFQLRVVWVSGSEGFLVMPAGQFDQGRLLGDVGDGEVIVRVRAARIDLDGPAQGGFGRTTQALLTKREAEGVLDLSILRIELRCAVERVDCLVVFLLAELQAAQDEETVGVIGRQSNGLLDINLGGLEMAEIEFNRGEAGKGGNVRFVLL